MASAISFVPAWRKERRPQLLWLWPATRRLSGRKDSAGPIAKNASLRLSTLSASSLDHQNIYGNCPHDAGREQTHRSGSSGESIPRQCKTARVGNPDDATLRRVA